MLRLPWSRRADTADDTPRALDIDVATTLASASGPMRLQVALRLEPGQWAALLGPSGAGKTTLLRLIAGLARPESGHVAWGDERWHDGVAPPWPTRRRRVGFVFQDHALFPQMTARRNVEFALRPGVPKSRAGDWLDWAGLAALAERRPEQLSGGQQQRLALARTLASQPRLLLLDEPLSALDAALRHELQDGLLRLRRGDIPGHGRPAALLVTHEPAEALRLAERLLRLEQGRIVQDLRPEPHAASDRLLVPGRVLGRGGDGLLEVEAAGRVCRLGDDGDWRAGDLVLLSGGGLRVERAAS
ncbi:molybdenum ABC transporter ATP-binding protein [Rubrivivax gelatinosus]|nr:molybdenum ABC transporter ATP-binding protein [Rubrivivax gelatinosus]